MSEMQFASVKDAVKWAEEVVTRPNLGSQLGKYFIKAGNGMDRQELMDIAHTITCITNNCKPFKGMAMRCVYRGHSRDDDKTVGDELARRMDSHQLLFTKAQRKSNEQLRKLGLCIVKAERAKELYADRYPVSRIAREVGISQPKFTTNMAWTVLYSNGLLIIRDMLSQAEREIGLELEVRGWL